MLLHAAVEAAPPGTSIEIEPIREIPLFDGDVEAEQGIPPAVRRLKIASLEPTACSSALTSTTTRCPA
jgi:NAD(P)H-dependent FMN reductase